MEKTNKGAISEQKLKVVYLPAEGGSTNNQGIPEEEEAGEASRVEEPVSGGMFPRGDGFDRGRPPHFLSRNFQFQRIIFILASNSFFVIRMAKRIILITTAWQGGLRNTILLVSAMGV